MWKSVFRVDVARNVAHGGGNLGVGLEQLLDLADGAEHGGVVAAAEFLADLLEREVREVAHEVHGDLAGSHGILDPLLTADDLFFDPVILADVVQDVVRRGNILVAFFRMSCMARVTVASSASLPSRSL